jgi:uncharacterized protein (DUF2062 family)
MTDAPPRRVRLRRLLSQIWTEHASPARLGAAVGLGIFIGCSPLYGLHTVIGLLLALPLRLNKCAVLLGTQISIPPVAPLLALASVQLGALLLAGTVPPIDASLLQADRLHLLLGSFAACWIVGSLLLGALLGLLGCLATASLFGWRRRRTA